MSMKPENSSKKYEKKKGRTEPNSCGSGSLPAKARSKQCKNDIFDNMSWISRNEETLLDLSRDLHPLSYFIGNKLKMVQEAFQVLNSRRMDALLPPELKNMSKKNLEEKCAKVLESLDDATIFGVLEGKIVAPSRKRKEIVDGKNKKEDDGPAIPKKKLKKKTKAKKRKLDSQSENEEESNQSKKKRKKSKKRIKKESKNKKELFKKEDSSEKPPKKEKTLMELLELEFRAKAIKALLKTDDKNQTSEDQHKSEADTEDAESSRGSMRCQNEDHTLYSSYSSESDKDEEKLENEQKTRPPKTKSSATEGANENDLKCKEMDHLIEEVLCSKFDEERIENDQETQISCSIVASGKSELEQEQLRSKLERAYRSKFSKQKSIDSLSKVEDIIDLHADNSDDDLNCSFDAHLSQKSRRLRGDESERLIIDDVRSESSSLLSAVLSGDDDRDFNGHDGKKRHSESDSICGLSLNTVRLEQLKKAGPQVNENNNSLKGSKLSGFDNIIDKTILEASLVEEFKVSNIKCSKGFTDSFSSHSDVEELVPEKKKKQHFQGADVLISRQTEEAEKSGKLLVSHKEVMPINVGLSTGNLSTSTNEECRKSKDKSWHDWNDHVHDMINSSKLYSKARKRASKKCGSRSTMTANLKRSTKRLAMKEKSNERKCRSDRANEKGEVENSVSNLLPSNKALLEDGILHDPLKSRTDFDEPEVEVEETLSNSDNDDSTDFKRADRFKSLCSSRKDDGGGLWGDILGDL